MLVVEDSGDIRLLVTRVVEQRSHRATVCQDGESAWEVWQQEGPFPLAIIDWQLPGIDGLELCRRIRAQPEGVRPFVVLATGHDRPGDQEMAGLAGANAYLPKPFSIRQLSAALEDAEARVDPLLVGIASGPPPAEQTETPLLQGPVYLDAARAPAAGGTLADIWARFREANLERLSQLEEATVALLERVENADVLREGERAAHKLAGSLGTFGLPEGSRLAREAESLLREGGGGDAPRRLAELVVALQRELERAPTEWRDDGTEAQPSSEGLLILVSTSDPGLAQRLTLEAAARGIRTVVASSAPLIDRVLDQEHPDVAVLDLDENEPGAIEAVTGLATSIPILALTTQDSLRARVRLARLGVRRLLPRAMPPAQVVQAVSQVLQRGRLTATVLAVDDDPQILAILEVVLAPDGLRVVPLGDPQLFWDTLQTTTPDLVVLDIDMPDIGGIDLCRAMRGDPRWALVPVLVLSAHRDSETIRLVFDAGADDFVSKPIIGPELSARVRSRIERVQLMRTLAEVDPLTGVNNRGKSSQQIEQFLELAARSGQPVSVALLDLDHFKSVNDRFGHAAGDAALRKVGELLSLSFRTEDVVGRWGGEEFLVSMYGVSREAAVQRMTGLLDQLQRQELRAPDGRPFRLTFSAGVAVFPDDGRNLHALYTAADGAAYRAKADGRARVYGAGTAASAASPAQERVDIVMVEDDEALAPLVLHALKTRGISTVWLKDGHAAVEALCGEHPRLVARVVLLDVDMPALDGLSVLRRLAGSGVLEGTRVIMLTARSGEIEVVQALELGAFDHVAKPFSVPVLLQRIRRALAADHAQ